MKTPAPHPVRELLLDDRNPRLPEHIAGGDQPGLIGYLFEHGVLEELAQSFLDNGYFDHEAVIVTKDKKNKNWVVLEGNRRVATLKILLEDPDAEGLAFVDLRASKKDREALELIPCYEVKNREDVYSVIGFRHIGGLKMWGPEAKARFVLEHVDLAAKAGEKNPFFRVGRQVGSNSQGIRSSYIAISILRHARDQWGLNVARILNERRFGVWQRALGSPEIREYIGLGDPLAWREVSQQMKKVNRERLKEVLADLVPLDGEEKAVISDSRLVTDYGRVIAHKAAHALLRKTRDLDAARQLVDELDLPSRIRKLKARADAILVEVQRTEMTEVLRSSIDDLFAIVKTLRALANE